METEASQTEFCSRCNQWKPWIDVYEIDLENVCVDCMTEQEKTLND